jgi:hypothetical protein
MILIVAALPISPPFYMTKSVARPATAPSILIDLLDGDGGAAHYNVALAMGYHFSATTTEPPVNRAQPNPTPMGVPRG